MKAGEPLLLLTRLKHITMRYVKKKNDQNYHKNSPVALPGVPYVRVCYGVFIRLLIQKVKHVLDGEGQGAASVRCAKDGLEQVVHKLLERALKTTTSEGHPNVLHASMFCWGLLWKPLVRGFTLEQSAPTAVFAAAPAVSPLSWTLENDTALLAELPECEDAALSVLAAFRMGLDGSSAPGRSATFLTSTKNCGDAESSQRPPEDGTIWGLPLRENSFFSLFKPLCDRTQRPLHFHKSAT